ncbi:hypothetical protein EV715DRAFT_298101 [Schizophyllum commune]
MQTDRLPAFLLARRSEASVSPLVTVNSAREIGVRGIRFRPSTPLARTRTVFNTLGDVYSTPSPSHVDSLGLATVSDLKNACEIDAGALLNVGDTPPLTSTSSPALLRFDTDSRGPPSDVAERIASHAATIFAFDVAFSTTLPTLSTSLNSMLSTHSSPPSPSAWPCSSNVVASPLDDVADAFDVALLDALDVAVATLAICVAALIEHRRPLSSRGVDYRSTTLKNHSSTPPLAPASSNGKECR